MLLYDFNCMTFYNGKAMQRVKRSVIARDQGRDSVEETKHRGFLDNEITLYDTRKLDTSHCMFVNPLECTTPRVSSHVNYGLWVVIIYQCRFTDYNKCTTLVRFVDNQGGYACVWSGSIQEMYCLLNFAVKLNCCKKQRLWGLGAESSIIKNNEYEKNDRRQFHHPL